MISWYLAVRQLTGNMQRKSFDALELYKSGGKDSAKVINGYLDSDYDALWKLWKEKWPEGNLGSLGRHIHFGMDNDYHDIINKDLPEIEKQADQLLSTYSATTVEYGFEELLHPIIREKAFPLFQDGYLRDAVLNSIVAVFDQIRARTKVDLDGSSLIGDVLSLTTPKLILSELESDSGQNDQKGFIQIFNGAYLGIRNPKAHSLDHDLTKLKAAQYLVFASLLARRIDEAKKP
jgi:uncharacterized protein (TIGR02391 family)